ncbi:sulfatase [Thalassotalea crassostreae]|uniref:sulfatase family protein n=1 Tax=Thalassotalea crassostreae TaxID=1763536 RepID=UPI0008384693|nr:sulfatase [Thalassotalea crassostreae]
MKSLNFKALALSLAVILPSAFAAEKPNIVVIFTDDQSYTAMGAMGNTEIKTPNMDQLANDGVIFDRHYNNTPICMASRASLMTGKYEYKHGANFQHGSMTKETFSGAYPVLLKSSGYYTGFAGKFGFPVTEIVTTSTNHNSYDKLPVNEFDDWAGGLSQTEYETKKNKYLAQYAEEHPHSTQAYAAWAEDFIIKAKASKKPFNMSVYFKAPHLPSKPDPAFDDVFKGITFTPAENFGKEHGEHLADQAKLGRQYISYYKKYGYFDNYNEVTRKYYQLIYGVDVALGKIRASLEEQGVADNTVIIFTSDNGYSQGAHGLSGKTLPYEEASRAPLIIFDPRNKANGKRHSALTAGVDLTATILALASVEAPKDIDGVSLLPLLAENSPEQVRESVTLMQLYGSAPTHTLAVVSGDFKYIFWPYEEGKMKAQEELYHVSNDSLEMNNLAQNPEYKKQLELMRKVYDAEVEKWQAESLNYNNYPQYGTIFNRNVKWEDKTELFSSAAKNSYQKELQVINGKSIGKNKDKNKNKNKKKKDKKNKS